MKNQLKKQGTATVGVIASKAELVLARRMRMPPDLFELRLDYLPHLRDSDIANLKRPLIFTARSADEGGNWKLSDTRRQELLLKFLARAAFIDVELHSFPAMQRVWNQAEHKKLKRICSLHDFDATPPLAKLLRYVQRAVALRADIFKLVTRADSIDSLLTLLDFLRRRASIQLCVMTTGKFGPVSRLLFPECGSAFVYAPLRKVFHDGQLTFDRLRRMRDFYAER